MKEFQVTGEIDFEVIDRSVTFLPGPDAPVEKLEDDYTFARINDNYTLSRVNDRLLFERL